MGERTVSFPFSNLGNIQDKKQVYEMLYDGIAEVIDVDDIEGVQIYPAKWPRKVLITMTSKERKDQLLVTGLELFNRHIELRDEDTTVIKVVIQDAPMEWTDDILMESLQEYGDIIRMESERIYQNGKPTPWKTGTRFVFFATLLVPIPHALQVEYKGKQVTVSCWYRQAATSYVKCGKCGSVDHATYRCLHNSRMCYICEGEGHLQGACPLNDGNKRSEEVVCFMGNKSVLSNFNMDCPITVDGTKYSCNEQYIQVQKALLFNDQQSASDIMHEVEPWEMKAKGRHVKNYNDREWKNKCEEIVINCVRAKFQKHESARRVLLETNNKTIGEATKDTFWGTGLHIKDENTLDRTKWIGQNLMGQILMQVRSELLEAKESENCDIKNTDTSILPQTRVSEDGTEDICEEIDKILTEGKQTNDKQEMIKQKKRLSVLIGDSNVKGLKLRDDLPVKVMSVSQGGTTIQDVENRATQVKVKSTDVMVAVLHVGTCNWKSAGEDIMPAETVYAQYIEALNDVNQKFPHAELVISSIPPRNTAINKDRNLKINQQIKIVNTKLEALGQSESNILYIDNDIGLMSDGEPSNELYTKTDILGVHFNERDRMILADNISNGIREAYYKAVLREDWNVVKTTKI